MNDATFSKDICEYKIQFHLENVSFVWKKTRFFWFLIVFDDLCVFLYSFTLEQKWPFDLFTRINSHSIIHSIIFAICLCSPNENVRIAVNV